MLRRLAAVAVLSATMTWAQAPQRVEPMPGASPCQQDGAHCLRTCSAATESTVLVQCVRTCEAKVDACRTPAADAGPAPQRASP